MQRLAGLLKNSSDNLRARLLRWREKIERVADRSIHRLFPLWWGMRWVRKNKEFNDQHDAKSFKAAKLPDGEAVRVSCVWVVEVYLASHVGSLEQRLRKLGLGKDFFLSDYDAIRSVLEARVRGGTAWAVDIGRLVAKRRAKQYWRSIPAELPHGVDSAFFKAVSALSGATVVVGQFRFDDETAALIEEPFRTQYQATATVSNGRVQLPQGAHLRFEAAAELRAMLRRRCERWMRLNLPGAFAEAEESITTFELLTFVKADPFGGRTPPKEESNAVRLVGPAPQDTQPLAAIGSGEEDYLSILGQRGSHNAWGCLEIEGLLARLATSLPGRRRTDDHLVFSARLADFHFELTKPKDKSSPTTADHVVHGTSWLTQSGSMLWHAS